MQSWSTRSASAIAIALAIASGQASAQQSAPAQPEGSAPAPVEEIAPTSNAEARTDAASAAQEGSDDVIVTATRRNERLQDVPLAVTAFSQAELTRKGIVGYDTLARETPGVVLNKGSANFNTFVVRGITTNGYGAGLQSTVAIYLDELPISTVGNATTLDPNLYDVERVEFLRGPQGTLFGSGSLSGALRILTKSPDLTQFDASALVDVGLTDPADAVRQRYNAMLNLPLVTDKLALRLVGFYRDEEGFVDNLGTGKKNANRLVDWGGRAILLWKPTDRFSARLLASYEDSDPKDSGLTTPSLGRNKRFSKRGDRYRARPAIYNATIDYDLDFARLTSSSTYSTNNGRFDLDVSGTFDRTVPFLLDIGGRYKTFVQETRISSAAGGKFDWVFGGYYLHRTLVVDGQNRSTPEFLAARGLSGLPDAVFNDYGSRTRSYELAAFGELTYRFTDRFWVTGGMRYGTFGTRLDTDAGFDSQYFAAALGGLSGPLALIPTPASSVRQPRSSKPSFKGSISFKPTARLTTYATVSTGYRTPVFNARAGSVSMLNPNDLVIPEGAGSDKLINYEVGAKGRLFGWLNASLAAYYIDWSDIQVQANRQSDAIQFATNIGAAVSKGIEFELNATPLNGLTIGVNGSLNDAKVTKLSASEAAISGAVDGARLASPHFQGALFLNYVYDIGGGANGFSGINVQHVGSFPNGFPNTPGAPDRPSALFDRTDAYEVVNLSTGITLGKLTTTFYVENVLNDGAVIYVHPEAFTFSRYGTLRPRTLGVRVGYNL